MLFFQKEEPQHWQSEFSNASKKMKERMIMHIDMDCFFVSVGLRSHPGLRGLPVAVTHAKAGGGGRASNSEVIFFFFFKYYTFL